MNLPQLLIDALTTEIRRVLPDHTVEAREPAEGELAATTTVKQVFITTEGIQIPEGNQIASGGNSTVLLIPIMVALVMPRPGSIPHAAQTLKRRLKLMQAVTRAARDFQLAQTGVESLDIVQEAPTLIEGYYVSITALELTFDLDEKETL